MTHHFGNGWSSTARVVVLHEHYSLQRCSKCAFAAAEADTPHSLKLLPVSTGCSAGNTQAVTYPPCTLVLPVQDGMEPRHKQCMQDAPGVLVDVDPRPRAPSFIPTCGRLVT